MLTSYRPDTTKHALMGFYAACVGAIAGLPFLAPILVDAGVSKSQVALLFLTFPVCKLVVAPAIGALSDRVGRTTHLLALSALLAFLGVLLIMVSPMIGLLIAGLVLLALGETSLFPLGDALTLKLLGRESREYGRIRAVGSATLICLVLLVGWLSQTTEGRLLLLPSVVGFAVTAGVSQAGAGRARCPSVRRSASRRTARRRRPWVRSRRRSRGGGATPRSWRSTLRTPRPFPACKPAGATRR